MESMSIACNFSTGHKKKKSVEFRETFTQQLKSCQLSGPSIQPEKAFLLVRNSCVGMKYLSTNSAEWPGLWLYAECGVAFGCPLWRWSEREGRREERGGRRRRRRGHISTADPHATWCRLSLYLLWSSAGGSRVLYSYQQHLKPMW